MPNAKKYILTGVILGSIAAVAAGLIAATNLITSKKIKQNEVNKVNAGIAEIYGVDSKIKFEEDLMGYKYAVHYYAVENSKSEFLGYAVKTSGSNMYGKISLIAGFDNATRAFMSVYMINNEQTYASTLVDNYITPLNNHEKSVDSDTDANCGATYGANLVREMIKDAKKATVALWSK